MKKYTIVFILIISMLLTGCWDAREINELGLVMAVGVDKSEIEEGGYRVSVQIARPSEAGGGGGGTAGGGGGSPVYIGAADGKTIFDAIRNVAKFSSRRIMWAHNNVIIIGEAVAREGITPVIDFFSHNPELRLLTPEMSGTGSSQVQLEGGAVFKRDRMIGFLSPDDARGISWIRGETRNSIVAVSVKGLNEKRISVELKRIKVKINPEWDGEKARFNIKLSAEGSIAEQDYPRQFDIEEFKAEVQKNVNDRVKKDLKASMKTVQTDYNSDVIGLGRMFHIKYKDLWRSGLGEKWSELYSNAIINISTDIKINTSTLFQDPTYLEKIEGEQE